MRFKYTLLTIGIILFSQQLNGQDSSHGIRIDPFLRLALEEPIHKPFVKTISGPDQTILYPVVLHGSEDALREIQNVLITNYGTFGTANLSAEQLGEITTFAGISQIEYSPLHEIQLDVSRVDIFADSVHSGYVNNTPYTGDGVIIGIIDTGVDFFHDDFRDPDDPEKTRILRIWDLSLTPGDGENHPELFEAGVEYTSDDIEKELRNETNGVVRSRDTNGHGTHVAGVAGGGGVLFNGKYKGIAPDADFIVVQFPGTGVTTQDLMHGMEYIFDQADKYNRPVVINLSLGGHGGSHDGTAGHELLINHFAQYPARVVVVAAGNSGALQNHTGSEISPGSSHTYTLNIPNYTPRSGPNNDYVYMYMWYEGSHSVQLIFESPNGYRDTIQTSDNSLSINTPDGAVDIYTHPSFVNPKGARIFEIFISDKEQDKYPRGVWSFNVRSTETATTVRYNTWIVAKSMNTATLHPSSHRSHTVTMPGTAEKAITVGAYNTKLQWVDKNNSNQSRTGILHDLATFSGGGPTRDLRQKPDITAPGRFIGAALSGEANLSTSQQLNDEGYAILSGTSISTPHVTGLVALMLEANPLLRSEDIQNILYETARGDDRATNLPNNNWGWGKVDALAAVREAALFVSERSMTHYIPDQYVLLQNYPNPFNPSTNIRFHIPEQSKIHLRVFDILGREVETLLSGEIEPGIHTVPFHARNLSSGIYFYRLETTHKVLTRSMLFIR